jgi:hypothetical protein
VPVLLVEGHAGRTIVGLSTLFSSEPAKTFAAEELMPALLRFEEAPGFALVFHRLDDNERDGRAAAAATLARSQSG